jgi:AraC-like DNA-binding protein
MNQFLLIQGTSNELRLFQHVAAIAFKKNTTIQLQSFPETTSNDLRIYYIAEGKHEWTIDGLPYILYPGDLAVILPGQRFGSDKGYFDIGALYWIHIIINLFPAKETEQPGYRGQFSASEHATVRKILSLNKMPVINRFRKAAAIFQGLQTELFNQEFGYNIRVNQLIDELLIDITRQLTQQHISQRDFPQTFMMLEQTLRNNLGHQWTVEEMAALVGLGTTAFTDKVKKYTGFSPLNYLINIRISEAIKLLKRQDVNVTDIALETGFYSSQHFSTTFKKLTGYTPSQFRKNSHLKN